MATAALNRLQQANELDDIALDIYEAFALQTFGHDLDLLLAALHRKFPAQYRQPPPEAKPTNALPGPRKVKRMAERRGQSPDDGLTGFSCFHPGDISTADEAIERLARVISTHPNSAVVVRDIVDQGYDEEAAITAEEVEDEQEFEAYLNVRRAWLDRRQSASVEQAQRDAG